MHESRRHGNKYGKVVPKATRRAVIGGGSDFVNRVLSGNEPMPAMGTPEARQLARNASYAKWGKADPRFLAAFEQYFYHDEKRKDLQNQADAEDEAGYDSDEEE